MLDSTGRRVFFDWVRELQGSEWARASGWSGVMTLPRVLSVATDVYYQLILFRFSCSAGYQHLFPFFLKTNVDNKTKNVTSMNTRKYLIFRIAIRLINQLINFYFNW